MFTRLDGEMGRVRPMIKFVASYPPTICGFPHGRYLISGRTWLEVPEGTHLSDVRWVPLATEKPRDPVPKPTGKRPNESKKKRDWSNEETAARKQLRLIAGRIDRGGAWGRIRKSETKAATSRSVEQK